MREANEPFDVVRYLATGRDRGRFIHERSDAGAQPDELGEDRSSHVIRAPRKYDVVSPELRTVVLKIHGGLDRLDATHDSYVITEDDYIDYLTRTSPNELIPAKLLAKLLNSHIKDTGREEPSDAIG